MHRKRAVGVAAAMVACFGLVLIGAGSAMAGPANLSVAPSLSTPVPLHSTAFAGWVFGDTGSVSAAITYKEPTLTCGTATQGVSATSTVLTGTSSSAKQTAAGTLIVCSGGSPLYIPFLVINGTETNLSNPVAAGDTVRVTATGSATKVSATFSDLTSPRTFHKTLSGSSTAGVFQEQLGDGLVDNGGSPVPIVNFGKIAFRSGKINGTALGSVSARSGPYNMVSSASVLQIATSALIPTTSPSGFNTTWKHS